MTKPLVHLSLHAKERLRERHDKHLLRYTDKRSFELSCYELLDRAEDTRRHLNDTALMAVLYADYGYDQQFSFKVYANALFIIVDNLCVTVLDTDVHAYSRQFKAGEHAVSKPAETRHKPAGAGPVYKARKRSLIGDR
jgi:hypothetical protein